MAIKKITLKIQGQGFGWGQISKSHCQSYIMENAYYVNQITAFEI